MNYEDYIYGGATLPGYRGWDTMRRIRLMEDKYTCQKCGRKHELKVHHLTYERFGKEEIKDLITLCVRCHGDLHYFGNRIPATERMILQQTMITQEEFKRKMFDDFKV